MLIYEGTKDNFLTSVEQDTIAVEIENNIYERMHRHTAKNEFRAWENSMEYMYKVLNDQDIPSDAGIAIEYNIPQTSKRVDFLISGYGKQEDAIAYEDRFVSEGHLIALSKHPRKITSSDAVHIYKLSEEDKNNRIFLFVRKNKDDNEAKEFYFLGEIFAEGSPRQIYMEKTKDNAFEIDYRLDVPVRSDIYDYIVSD